MITHTGQQSGELAPFQVLKALAEISIVVGAGLFLIGWSYLYGYYRGFGLSAGELNLPLQAILIYSLPVIETTAFLSGVIIWIISSILLKRMLGITILIVLGLALAAVLTPWYATKIGRANANRDEFLSTSTLPFVKLEGTTGGDDVTGCSLDESNYHLLLRANGQIYVILPLDNAPEGTSQGISANLRVCTFPESRIQATRIQIGIVGKE
jgi:hypothetical protein